MSCLTRGVFILGAMRAPLGAYGGRVNEVNFQTSTNNGGFLSQSARVSKVQKIDASTLESLPQRPKKPPTPWLTFVRERKDDVLRQKDKMKASELATILAKEWKQIDKSRYQQEFELTQKEYHRQLEEYEKSLTDEQRDHLEMLKDSKRETKVNRLLRKTNPPTMPRNPANFYCHERSKHADIRHQLQTRKPSEVFKDIFKEYRELPEGEKQKYIGMQEEDKNRFQHEFTLWYESIQNDDRLTKAAREKADQLRSRYQALGYI